MPKVKCEDCVSWLDSGRVRKDPTAMFSFHYTYNRKVGSCMNEKCSRETSGYTGMVSSHKMSRIGNIERYCKFFKQK